MDPTERSVPVWQGVCGLFVAEVNWQQLTAADCTALGAFSVEKLKLTQT